MTLEDQGGKTALSADRKATSCRGVKNKQGVSGTPMRTDTTGRQGEHWQLWDPDLSLEREPDLGYLVTDQLGEGKMFGD